MKALTAGCEDLGGDERQAARYCTGDEAAHWLACEERYERMLAPFTGHVMTAVAIGRADRVVDVGCGTGSTTRAARRVATAGEALGVDLSAVMLRQAARRAQEEGLANVRFEHGCTNSDPLATAARQCQTPHREPAQ